MLWKSTDDSYKFNKKTGNSLIKATQIFICFRKKGKHFNFLVMADAHNIIDRILYLLTVHFTNNETIVLVKKIVLV